MKINRRSFFAALAAPLLAPLAKLLPKPAATLNKGDTLGFTFTGSATAVTPWMGFDPGKNEKTVVYFWASDGLYILDGDCKTVISRQPYAYWHVQSPLVPLEPKFEHMTFSFDRGSRPAPEA